METICCSIARLQAADDLSSGWPSTACGAQSSSDASRRLPYTGRKMAATVPRPRVCPGSGRRWLAPPGEPASGWLEHRLRLGVTEGHAELGDLRWLECNAAELNGVSFSKGCFVGQENTARMNWRSKINRRLVVVETDVSGPRTRAFYPELGLAVEHRRIDDLAGAIVPGWLKAALAQPSTA
jgi:folate-binding protein YgfZ